jgi:hypothetical protein
MTQLLDPYPIWLLLVLFMALTLASYEIAFRVGRWWQAREPGEQEGPTDTLVGALLALMAFLLAVTMSMASDRFDSRRGLVLEEANIIGNAYLQADYLPEVEAARMQELMREYIALRIVDTDDQEAIAAGIQTSLELQSRMWDIADAVISTGYNPDIMSSFGDALTDVVAISQTRVTAGIYARVPETVLWLLLVGSALSLAMVGYSAGLKGKRSVLSAFVLTAALGVVLMLVIDLDRPQDGIINVSQRPLLDVQQWMTPPA